MCVSESVAPLVTAPFSEVYGRRWVFLVSELLFILMCGRIPLIREVE